MSHQCRGPCDGLQAKSGQNYKFALSSGYGVRVDTHIYAGYVIPPYYDSLIAKLIVKAKTREEAIIKMYYALDEFIIEGIKTTIPFHKKLMMNDKFEAETSIQSLSNHLYLKMN